MTMTKLVSPTPNPSPDIATSLSERGPRGTLGAEIRKLRKARGLSISELAAAIDRSVGFVSQLERGRSEASISDLKRIAQALGVPLGWFFLAEQTPPAERGQVVRAGGRRRLGTVTDGLVEELLSPDIGGAFEMFLSVFAPGAERSHVLQRDTEEEGYVVQGCLELWIGERFHRLQAGDSFRIVREPFRWRNPGPEEARVVWVIAPPIY
ncbi:MAG TPA: XRE family transcriptional regulator [Candidatus Competibacteraceae bacterium]|nr:XRE family transcriptional regulator [Candidatus Competibacteraceae bacterium]